MIQGLSKVLTLNPREELQGDHIDDPVERAAVVGAAAIQLLIAERDSLRNSANAREQDLAALTAMNEKLRGRIFAVRNRYLELATGIIGQLEQLEQATREAMQD
jgi:hypothetical protein